MRTIFALVAAMFMAASVAGAQAGGQAADEAAIRQLPQKHESAWNSRDTQKLLDLYTDDALVVQMTGEVLKGRPAIEANFKENFNEMGDARLSLDLEDVRFLDADTAVLVGTSSVTGGKMPGGTDRGHYMVIARKLGGEWRASEVHLAATLPEPGSEAVGTAGRSEAEAEAEVTELGEKWEKAFEERDWSALEEIYADDYTFVDPMGNLMTREQDIEQIKSGKLKFESHEHSNVERRIYGDTAVVTGVSTIKGTYEGEDFSGKYRWTDTYVRKDGEWKVAASQVTRMADETETKEKK